jgi:flagellar hook assembly protein FlgD
MKFTISIYDEKGRVMRTLARDEREPGKHLLEWDGRNDGGTQVPSGVYYLHVEMEGHGTVARFKVVLQ